AEVLEALGGRSDLDLEAGRVAAHRIETPERAFRDRLLDSIAQLLRQRHALEEVQLGLLGPPELESREPGPGLQFGHQIALRSQAPRGFQGRLELRQSLGSVAAIERELAQELARQERLAPGADLVGQGQGAAELLLGALGLPAPPAQEADRQQGHGLALQVTGLARDPERLAEVLLGQVPLPEPV